MSDDIAVLYAVSPEVQRVLDALTVETPCHIDTLCETLGVQPAQMTTLLMTLEVQGRVRRWPGGLFTREMA